MEKEFTNFAFTYLDEPLPATTIQGNLKVADGSNFPTGRCTIVIYPANEQPTKENAEIIDIYGRAGNELMLQYKGRGQQGTTIKNHAVGANVILSFTAGDITDIFREIDGFQTAINSHIGDIYNPHGVKASQISEYGVPELNSEGKIPNIYLPSYVDDVLEFDGFSQFPNHGEVGKIYVAKDTNITYRWAGTIYVEISSSIALGETSSTAYRGDRGKIAYDHSQIITGNPHNVTIEDIGVENIMNIILGKIYPVGSVYTSFSDNRNPNIILGFGTWERIKGRVVVGLDESQEEFNVVNKTGGSKYLQEHWHDIRYSNGLGLAVSVTGDGVDTLNLPSWVWDKNAVNSRGSGSNLFTDKEGTGHSGNLQPYVVAYMWERTG